MKLLILCAFSQYHLGKVRGSLAADTQQDAAEGLLHLMKFTSGYLAIIDSYVCLKFHYNYGIQEDDIWTFSYSSQVYCSLCKNGKIYLNWWGYLPHNHL